MGMVSPVGLDVESSWQSMVNGQGGIVPISLFDPTGYSSRIAGEVKGFDPLNYMDKKNARRVDRFTQFALAAADEALRMSGLEIATENDRVAVIVGTAMGGMTTLCEEYDVLHAKGPGRVSPFLIPMMLPDMASGQLSIHFGARGVNYALVSACASGADCIGEAANIISRGDSDAALAGGAEAAITPISMAGFCALRSLSERNDDPARASRPFDRDRDGFVMAEGSAILVLEAEDHAKARGATILAEIAGYGATSDAFHVTQPDENGRGAAAAMRLALERAGLRPDEIDYVNAHGTSTPMNDKLETLALKKVFGDYAQSLPVSSTKSMTGHLLGAAGAVEAAVCIKALQTGIVPPTINLDEPDQQCDLDYVPNVSRAIPLKAVMTNSLGFGGHNSSLVLRQYASSQ